LTFPIKTKMHTLLSVSGTLSVLW